MRCSVGCERGRTDDGPVGGRTAAGRNAEHGLEGYMAIEAAIVAECELVEIGIEVLVAATTCQRPRPTSPAARADKPFRPPLRRKVGRTAFFVRKLLLKPAQRASAAHSAML